MENMYLLSINYVYYSLDIHVKFHRGRWMYTYYLFYFKGLSLILKSPKTGPMASRIEAHVPPRNGSDPFDFRSSPDNQSIHTFQFVNTFAPEKVHNST